MTSKENNEGSNGVSSVVLLIYLVPILVTGSIVLGVTSPQTSPYGAQRLAIIPVYFDDQPPLNNISNINDLVFTDANEHIQELSFGMTWLVRRISGWVHLQMSVRTYGESEFLGANRLVKDAVAVADSTFDFSSCDRVIIVHAGPSWQRSNKRFPSTCWVPIVIPTNDGVTFTEAIVISEEDPSDSLVHELCHGFGAVDLYNLPRSRDGLETNETYIKYWCIMGSGYHQMCLFNKNKIGWIPNDAIFTYSQESYRLSLISINETTFGYRGVRVNSLNHSGYFLFEARAGKGILATFVDERKRPGYGIVDLVHVMDEDRAYLRIGEAYHNQLNNFSIRVICQTENGFNISISNSVSSGVDDYSFSYPLPSRHIRNIDVTESYEHLTYTAIEREIYLNNEDLHIVEVYRSHNYGRDWDFLYNTSIVGMNCSEPSISILNGKPILFVRSWNSSGTGFLEMFNDTTGSSFQRLEDLNQWRTIDSSSDRDNSLVYVVWCDWNTSFNVINFGTWDGSYWNTSWNPIQHGVSPKISPVSTGYHSQPYILYKSGESNTYVNLTRFGETECIQSWKNESAKTTRISEYDITVLEGESTIVLHENGSENNTETDIIRIINGNTESGFKEVLQFEGYYNPHLFRVNTSGRESIWLSCANRTDYFFNISSGRLVPISTSVRGEIHISDYSEFGLESVIIIIEGRNSIMSKLLFLFNGPIEPFLETLSYYAQDSIFVLNPLYFGVYLLGLLIITPTILRRERLMKHLRPEKWRMGNWCILFWFKGIQNRLTRTIKDEMYSPKNFLATFLVGFLALYISVLLFPTRLLWSSTYLYYWHIINPIETLLFFALWISIPILTIRAWKLFINEYSKRENSDT